VRSHPIQSSIDNGSKSAFFIDFSKLDSGKDFIGYKLGLETASLHNAISTDDRQS
jgi:hypothetical protein